MAQHIRQPETTSESGTHIGPVLAFADRHDELLFALRIGWPILLLFGMTGPGADVVPPTAITGILVFAWIASRIRKWNQAVMELGG